MLQINPIASSSQGNCYVLQEGDSMLMIECGLRLKEISQAVNFGLHDMSGCLISHMHADHSKAVKDLARLGVGCYMSKGTREALGIKHHRIKEVEAGEQFNVGSWKVLPFETIHDAAEPLGFLIAKGQNKILFATDTAYIRPRFKGLTHIMVECNYHAPILDDNIQRGAVAWAMRNRLVRSHFSLDNVLEFLKANDMSTVQGIWLMHLSDHNSDEKMFKRKVAELVGRPVYVC